MGKTQQRRRFRPDLESTMMKIGRMDFRNGISQRDNPGPTKADRKEWLQGWRAARDGR